MLSKKLEYERGLHPAQMDSFLDPNGVLFPLRDVLKSNDFQIEFRKDYFNIYYKGGNLLKVKGSRRFGFEFDINYCNNKPETQYKSQIESILKQQDLYAAIMHLDYLTSEMESWWAAGHDKKERREQHSICQVNRQNENDVYVVDIEYAATGYGRADILAVKHNGQSGKYKVYLIEYKQGNKSVSSGLKIVDGVVLPTSSTGSFISGIYKHYEDASRLAGLLRNDLLNTVRNSIYTRNRLGLAAFPSAETLDSIKFDDEIEMRFVLSDYKKLDAERDVLERELSAVRIKEKESRLKWDCILISADDYRLRV